MENQFGNMRQANPVFFPPQFETVGDQVTRFD
jgi:hypothetical protein